MGHPRKPFNLENESMLALGPQSSIAQSACSVKERFQLRGPEQF